MNFLTSSLWAISSVASRAAGSFIVNKIIAIYFGPAGLTLFSHFQNLIGILIGFSQDGINVGVIKFWVNDDTHSLNYQRKIFWAGLIINLAFFFLTSIVIFVFRKDLINVFAFPAQTLSVVFLLLGLIVLHILNYYFISLLLAKRYLKIVAFLNTIAGLTSVLFVWGFASRLSLFYVLLGSLSGPAISCLINYIILLNHATTREVLKYSPPRHSHYKELLDFVFMALSMIVFGKVAEFFIRQYFLIKYDLYITGLWQSVIKFSEYYSMAFTSLAGILYYPKMAELINVEESLRSFVRKSLVAVSAIAIPGFLFLYIFADFFLEVFFDKNFKAAKFLLDFQLLGDFFKFLSFILAFILKAQSRIWVFVLTQGVSTIAYIGLLYLCTAVWDVDGLTIAHSMRFTGYLLFFLIFYRKLIFY